MIVKSVINALTGRDWQSITNTSRSGLVNSFIALAVTIPFGLLIARAILQYNANTSRFPFFAIAITLMFIAATFPVLAFLFTKGFKKEEQLYAWLVLRNWAFFLIMAGFAALAGLYLLDVLPFSFVYFLGLGLYLATLGIDIRLAERIAGFGWTISVIVAITISIATMIIILNALGLGVS